MKWRRNSHRCIGRKVLVLGHRIGRKFVPRHSRRKDLRTPPKSPIISTALPAMSTHNPLIRSDEGLALETSAIVSFTAFHYPHQHTVDTPI